MQILPHRKIAAILRRPGCRCRGQLRRLSGTLYGLWEDLTDNGSNSPEKDFQTTAADAK
jgi:hypothetical protein